MGHSHRGSRHGGEEAFFVVVGVDEPAGDPIYTVAADFAGIGVEHIHAVDLDSQAAFGFENNDARLAEDDEGLPLPVFLRSSALCRLAFMRALSTGIQPSLSNSKECAS